MNSKTKRMIRHKRVRAKIVGTAQRPRLSVFRSHKHVFLQLIDDAAGKTLVSAGSAELKAKKVKLERAKLTGDLLAERAVKAGIKTVIFDRGGYAFQGRVKSIAEALTKAGVKV